MTDHAHIQEMPQRPVSPNVTWEPSNIGRAERENRNRHDAAVLWFTGPPASGKSTLARILERRLFANGAQTMLLDGDQLRHGLCGDLGFTFADRRENIRRAGEVARLFFEHGNLVLCAFVSPFQRDRDAVRRLFPVERFFEIYVLCEPAERRRRDRKGLYARADNAELENMTGVAQPYEVPNAPEFVANTTSALPEPLAATLLNALRCHGIVPPASEHGFLRRGGSWRCLFASLTARAPTRWRKWQ